MAAFNAEAHVRAALLSALAQRRPGLSLEVFVVNDGSTDHTAEVVRAVAATHAGVHLIETQNQGPAAARNVAIEALPNSTDLVSFLDADDLLPPDRYERDLALFAADAALDLTYGTTVMFREATANDTGPAPGSKTATGRGLQLGAGMYRYGLIRQVGAFDTSFAQAEDLDFLLRMFELSPKYAIRDDHCLYYRRHGGNLTRDTAALRREFARALLFSMRRRRANGLPPPPPEVFAKGGLQQAHGW